MRRSEVRINQSALLLTEVCDATGAQRQAEAESFHARPTEPLWHPGERPGRSGLVRRN
ncbi:hypothetical protein [Alicyclobacillus shizuokensis]|uniref:hypothetical protein n=1 Tax=Alicyclobacillus shizuokensis TaxID=392014 RepID=UPI000AE0DAD9|nr:hypothetical protein [Alicyclobacillus shizuokensis]